MLALLLAVPLGMPVSEHREATALLERAQRARSEWNEACEDARYELCATFGWRRPGWTTAECIYRLPAHRAPPPRYCGGSIGNALPPVRPTYRNTRHPRRSRRALHALAEILEQARGWQSSDPRVERALVRARSIARLTQVDEQLERWLEQTSPASIERVAVYLDELEAEANRLVEDYAEVVMLGDPRWAMAATARIALVYQLAVDRTEWLEIPARYRRRGRWFHNEFCQAVQDAVWDWAPRLQERRDASYRLCAREIRLQKQRGPIVAGCETEGAMLGIEELMPPLELFELSGQTHATMVSIPVVIDSP